jgi:hypothetical protein
MPATARQVSDLAARTRLRVPTLAVGAHPAGDALHRQLTPIADDLCGAIIPDCGHIIPLDRPDQAATLLTSFLTAGGCGPSTNAMASRLHIPQHTLRDQRKAGALSGAESDRSGPDEEKVILANSAQDPHPLGSCSM